MSSGDQLRCAEVEGMGPRHPYSGDVGQRGQHEGPGELHQRVTGSGDHQRRRVEQVQVGQRGVARHRLEQGQALQSAEPEVVARGDRQHRDRLAEAVLGHLTERAAERLVVGTSGGRDQDRTLDPVREAGRQLDDDRAAQRVPDQDGFLDPPPRRGRRPGPGPGPAGRGRAAGAGSGPSPGDPARRSGSARRGSPPSARGRSPRCRSRARARWCPPPAPQDGGTGGTTAGDRRSATPAPVAPAATGQGSRCPDWAIEDRPDRVRPSRSLPLACASCWSAA